MDLLLNPVLMPVAAASEEAPVHMSFIGLLAYIGLTVAIVFGMMAFAKKGLGQRVFKNPITSAFEQLYLFIENMCVGTIGSHGRKYVPMIMTFWLLIFTANVVSLFFADAPTADVSFNLALALCAVGYVQWEGIKANGFFGHLSHFAGPKLGPALIIINILIFAIEIISELLKNVSLSLRLYGNIHGGHMAADAMTALGTGIINIGGVSLSIPFGAFLLPIKLLTCVVQALIFTLLTCVYLSLVTHHEHEHDESHAHDDQDEQMRGAKYAEAFIQ